MIKQSNNLLSLCLIGGLWAVQTPSTMHIINGESRHCRLSIPEKLQYENGRHRSADDNNILYNSHPCKVVIGATYDTVQQPVEF